MKKFMRITFLLVGAVAILFNVSFVKLLVIVGCVLFLFRKELKSKIGD